MYYVKAHYDNETHFFFCSMSLEVRAEVLIYSSVHGGRRAHNTFTCRMNTETGFGKADQRILITFLMKR